MDQPTTADRTPSPGPAPAVLAAPGRERVDAFLRETRPWALRQARRSYRHLPESVREQAVDRAYAELRAHAPRSLERRALAAALAEHLTEALRHVHAGWCERESSALLRREGAEPVQPDARREGLARFVDQGLGGLERAVLQLEIGAGRDTRTARAALRLGPRQYSTHREAGLSKLRDAISAQVVGRACDQHVASIVGAATGDKAAMRSLNAGPHRCRYCAREARGLRGVLHERLAVAPWPLAIKPAGLLAAKLGALGAVAGGKGAGGTGAGVLSSAAGSGGAAATVLAVAALATGTAAIVAGDGEAKPEGGAERVVQGAGEAPKRTDRRPAPRRPASPAARPAGAGRDGRARLRPARAGGATTVAATPPATTAPALSSTAPPPTPPAAAPEAEPGPVTAVAEPVTGTVGEVTDTVTDVAPPVVDETLDKTVEQVTAPVGDVTGAVDDLLP